MTQNVAQSIFVLRSQIAMESFEQGALLLNCEWMEMGTLNPSARNIVQWLDGRHTLADVAEKTGMMGDDVQNLVLEMEQSGIVRRVVELSYTRAGNMSETKYLVNPEVSFRPEEDGGGILYNAETDMLEVINEVAETMWNFLEAPRTADEIVAHLMEAYEGALLDQVKSDTTEFLESMMNKKLIGVVKE